MRNGATSAENPPVIKRAMILAAGLGTRMRPITQTIPKPLVAVQGRTLLDHSLDRLQAAGVEEVVVNVHYLADQVEAHLKSRKSPRIILSDERAELLDTGGGLAKALPHFKGEPFFYLNSDSIWLAGTRDALTEMRRAWDPARMDVLMLLAATTHSTGVDWRGDFTMDPLGLLTPRAEGRVAPFVWAGVQIMHPRLLEGAPAGRFSTWVLWNKALKARRMFGIRLDGQWMHIGTPEGLIAAEAALANP